MRSSSIALEQLAAREHYFLPAYHLTQKLLTSLRYPWLSERARLALSRSTEG